MSNTNGNFFDNENFQDQLVALLSKDVKALQDCGSLLEANDFKPLRGMRYGRPRWITAECVLAHFRKYHEPVGLLINADVMDFATTTGMGERQIAELTEYLAFLASLHLVAPDSVVSKVIRFKRGHLKAAAIQELAELHTSGQLTDEKWQEISQKACAVVNSDLATTNYFAEAEDRITKREMGMRRACIPWTFIDPLDSLIRCLGRKQLGLILAPYKRGKSLMLLWLALAYILQRLNVLYLTLEDPKDDVENRLDAIVSHIPIKMLEDKPNLFRKRFEQYQRMVRTQLRIHDGTEGKVSIPRIEQILLNERNQGFVADAVIVDYDDEVLPTIRHKDRRFEFADIYRDLAQLGRRYNLITWTAAQTQRGTESLKIISGDTAAEDISKIRKVSLALGIGKGEWAENSLYIHVAAHKFDKQHVGCEIIPDLERMLIYDRDATLKATRAHSPDDI